MTKGVGKKRRKVDIESIRKGFDMGSVRGRGIGKKGEDARGAMLVRPRPMCP
jgi:hypothetical protein